MNEVNIKFWLLTFDYFKKDIKKSEDNLIVLLHWLLLQNDFQVLGPGNENKIDENELPSDILPLNWSQDEIYKLRYIRDEKLFLLNGVKAGDSLIFNFYDVTTEKVSSAALGNIKVTVLWISDMLKNKENFQKTVIMLQKDLIDPMQKESNDKKAVSTQTQSKQPENTTESSPLFISRTEPGPYRNIPSPDSIRNPFPTYGMPDLNPLGGLRNPGEGMIFNPFGNERSRIFPGIPPMARFDPMHPSNPDPMRPGLRRPNPDHMRPPDFDDNLYM